MRAINKALKRGEGMAANMAPEVNIQLFKSCFDFSSEALFILDVQSVEPFRTVFSAVNNRGCELFGLPREIILTLEPLELFGKSIDTKVIGAINERLVKYGSHHHEMDLFHSSGKKIAVEIFSTLILTDKEKLVFVRVRNIEERKQAMYDLQIRKTFMNNVLNTIKSLVIVLDHSGRILDWNQQCERLTGYSLLEIKDKYLWDVLLHDDDKDEIHHFFHYEIPETHQNVWVTKNGEHVEIEWSNSTVFHPSGEVEYVIGTGIDVTGRIKAEKSLLESTEKYRRLIENSPDGIVVYENEKLHFLNTEAKSIFGISEAQPKQLLHLIHPKDHDMAKKIMGKLFHGEKELIHTASMEILHPSGKNKIVEAKGITMGNSQVLVMVRDHTDKIMAERERSKLFSYLTDVLSSTAEGILGIDEKEHVVFANQVFLNWIELTFSDLKNAPASFIFNRLFPLANWDLTALLSSSEPLEFSRNKNGKIQHFEVRSAPFQQASDTVQGTILTFYDITDRFNLSKANNIYYEAITSGIVVQNAKGSIVFANQKACSILGYDKGSIYGMTSASREWQAVKEDLSPIQPEEHPAMITFNEKKEINNFVMGVYHPLEKEYRWILVDTRILYKDEGVEVPYVISTFQDITEKVHLDRLIRSREKTNLIGQLATSVAHEIRNPLTSINGFLKMMAASNQINQTYMEIINKELERLAFVANEFLTLGRAESLSKTELNLHGDILVPVIQLLTPSANMEGIRVDYKDFAPHVKVIGVKNQLKQLFLNILKNSLEAIHFEGKITLTVTLSKEYVTVEIQDNGAGISQDRLKHLGEPFYSIKEKGTGLGLAICKKIVQEHKGEMDITSTEGSGTTVRVYLPCQGSGKN